MLSQACGAAGVAQVLVLLLVGLNPTQNISKGKKLTELRKKIIKQRGTIQSSKSIYAVFLFKNI